VSEESKQVLKLIGSPSPAGSKNDVFRIRSVNDIVIAPARNDSHRSNSGAVIPIDHKIVGFFRVSYFLALCSLLL